MNDAGASIFDRLRAVPVFQDMPGNALAALARESVLVEFLPGDRLLVQSEVGDFALVIVSGDVSVVNESAHGDSLLGQLSAPVMVGEVAALGRLPRTAGVVAVTPVSAMRLPREVLARVCQRRPEILQSVISQLGQHLLRVSNALGLFSTGLTALERDDFDPTILDDLNHPTPEVRDFAEAFERLAHRITIERRHRDEMASAALIQLAMLPTDLHALPLAGRAEVFADIKPARDVGGDLYDVFMLDDTHLAVAIGDVCGKGVPASLFMSATATTLRISARNWHSLPAMLTSANDLLCARNPTMMFATLFFGVLDLDSGRFEYANCGHNPPLAIDRDGAVRVFAHGGAPLGLAPGRAITSASIDLAAGDGLFLFTDGVTESVDETGELYGDARLQSTLARLAGLDAAGRVQEVIADVTRFAGAADQFDDITCLALVRR